MKLDFNDILIKPARKTSINSRSEISILDENNMLPLFTAPMDTVVSNFNIDTFINNKITAILPRGHKTDLSKIKYNNNLWFAYSLNEFREIFILNEPNILDRKINVLIDVANGHMPLINQTVEETKNKWGEQICLMVGNVANPHTYYDLSEAGADYVRIGVGNGGSCLTSQQTGVGYPMVSLISECYNLSCTLKHPAKIVADGGFKCYADVIKGLALGADYVMLGSILNKALESAGDTYRRGFAGTGKLEQINQYSAYEFDSFENGVPYIKEFRGMSTKEVQKSLGKTNLKTSEGINKQQPVEYTINGWINNFEDYLKSAMSYTNAKSLEEFIGKPEIIEITNNAYERFNK